MGISVGVAANADWIEIDVRRVDNELIVIHDELLERTTNGSGSVYDFDLAHLRLLLVWPMLQVF